MTAVNQYLTPLRLFKEGFDTDQIKDLLGYDESTVYNLMHKEREEERKLMPVPPPPAYSRPPQPYIGKEVRL